MEISRIVSLDTNTKIQYSLFNFFAPIATAAVMLVSLEAYNIISTLIGIISILVGLFLLISNLIKYNRFLHIGDQTISICSGNFYTPKLIKMIKLSEIENNELKPDLSVTVNGKKTKLLHAEFSLFGSICILGPLLIFIILKNFNVSYNKVHEIKTLLPELTTTKTKQPGKAENLFINFITWLFILFITSVGCLGILLTPFYAFLG